MNPLLCCTGKSDVYLQSSVHFGGLVTFSLPHGKVRTVAPQKHFTSTVSGQG